MTAITAEKLKFLALNQFGIYSSFGKKNPQSHKFNAMNFTAEMIALSHYKPETQSAYRDTTYLTVNSVMVELDYVK